MGKIHIRGGSPLRLKFEGEDSRDTLAVRLEPIGSTGEYWVMTSGEKLEAIGRPPAEPDRHVFTPRCPTHQTCEIDYNARAPAKVT